MTSLTKILMKGKKKAVSALQYSDKALGKLHKSIKSGTEYLDKNVPEWGDKIDVKQEQFLKRYRQVSNRLDKSLKPAREFSKGSQEYMSSMFMKKQNPITVITQRKTDGKILVNTFNDARDAVEYIKVSKQIGNKLIKINKK